MCSQSGEARPGTHPAAQLRWGQLQAGGAGGTTHWCVGTMGRWSGCLVRSEVEPVKVPCAHSSPPRWPCMHACMHAGCAWDRFKLPMKVSGRMLQGHPGGDRGGRAWRVKGGAIWLAACHGRLPHNAKQESLESNHTFCVQGPHIGYIVPVAPIWHTR